MCIQNLIFTRCSSAFNSIKISTNEAINKITSFAKSIFESLSTGAQNFCPCSCFSPTAYEHLSDTDSDIDEPTENSKHSIHPISASKYSFEYNNDPNDPEVSITLPML